MNEDKKLNKIDIDKLLNFNKKPNNIHNENEINNYQFDSSEKQYYPSNSKDIIKDETDILMMYLGFFRQQLLMYMIDDFGTIDYNLTENFPNELLKFPENIIKYNNQSYKERTNNFITNTNVPIGWNIALKRSSIIGEFICPAEVLEYVKRQKAEGLIPNSNIPRDIARYEACKNALEEIISVEPKLTGHALMCLAGAFWVECGWKFENVFNAYEASGNGVNGTGGYTGAGETWFGLTFWSQKIKVINGLGLNCAKTEREYKPGRMISDLPISKQAEVLVWYLKNMVPQYGEYLIEFSEGDKTDGEAQQCIGASYLFKAGNFKNSGDFWEDAIVTAERYMKSVSNKFDGFALAIYMSMMMAYWLENDEIPEGDPWDA